MSLRERVRLIKENTSFGGFFKDFGGNTEIEPSDDYKNEKGARDVDIKTLDAAWKIVSDSAKMFDEKEVKKNPKARQYNENTRRQPTRQIRQNEREDRERSE